VHITGYCNTATSCRDKKFLFNCRFWWFIRFAIRSFICQMHKLSVKINSVRPTQSQQQWTDLATM